MTGEGHEEVDVVIHLRGGGVQRISPTHRSYDPLAYVLLNPFGLDLSGKPISVAEFYAFHLQVLHKNFKIFSSTFC